MNLSCLDKGGVLPEQIWYDSLRASDNGRYSRTTNNSPKADMYQLKNCGHKSPIAEYLKEKLQVDPSLRSPK